MSDPTPEAKRAAERAREAAQEAIHILGVGRENDIRHFIECAINDCTAAKEKVIEQIEKLLPADYYSHETALMRVAYIIGDRARLLEVQKDRDRLQAQLEEARGEVERARRQSVDEFVDNLLVALRDRGVDTEDWDGDDPLFVIIADGVANQAEKARDELVGINRALCLALHRMRHDVASHLSEARWVMEEQFDRNQIVQDAVSAAKKESS